MSSWQGHEWGDIAQWVWERTGDEDVTAVVAELEWASGAATALPGENGLEAAKTLNYIRAKYVPPRLRPLLDEDLRIQRFPNPPRYIAYVTHTPTGVFAEHESNISIEDAVQKARDVVEREVHRREREVWTSSR